MAIERIGSEFEADEFVDPDMDEVVEAAGSEVDDLPDISSLFEQDNDFISQGACSDVALPRSNQIILEQAREAHKHIREQALAEGRSAPPFYPPKEVTTADFFPVSRKDRKLSAARAVCMLCEVRTECLEWALTGPGRPQEGVWGGTSEEERIVMIRQRTQ